MNWKDEAFKNFRLYAVTDLTVENEEILTRIEQAYRGGADIVQLRTKVLSDAALIRLGTKVRTIATKARKLFMLNDRVDMAMVTQADGVHLGQGDMPVALARRLVSRMGRRFWIGKSVHSMKQALKAVKEGADLLGVGPVFATPTKPQVGAVGLGLVRQVKDNIQIPWVAIGGISAENLSVLLEAGATRIAVVRAIFGARDPKKAAFQLKKLMRG